MSTAPPSARAQRYANKLNLNARLQAQATQNARSPSRRGGQNGAQIPSAAPATAPPTTPTSRPTSAQTQPAAPARANRARRATGRDTSAPSLFRRYLDFTMAGGSPPSPSNSSGSSSDSHHSSSDLPWSPTYPNATPVNNLLGVDQPQANTDLTCQLPWPARLLSGWNFVRLYGTTLVATNDGHESDFFTGRLYGYVDRQDPNTGLTLMRLQAFFKLSALLHLHRFAIMSAILYRIPLTLLRYNLIKHGYFPLFEFDVMVRWYLHLVVLFVGWVCFSFWPLNLRGHIYKLVAAFLIQTTIWSLFQEQKEFRDLVFQLHPVVWVSADVFWTILHDHTTLPVPNASTMWYIAGLEINPIYLLTKLSWIAVQASTRWNWCGNFGKEVQSLCFLTPEADFPALLRRIQDPLTTTQLITEQATRTELRKLRYLIPDPTVVTETDTKTVYKGPVTDAAVLSEYITGRTTSMGYAKAFVATVAQTFTASFTSKTS